MDKVARLDPIEVMLKIAKISDLVEMVKISKQKIPTRKDPIMIEETSTRRKTSKILRKNSNLRTSLKTQRISSNLLRKRRVILRKFQDKKDI
jgi:hypothetical protein